MNCQTTRSFFPTPSLPQLTAEGTLSLRSIKAGIEVLVPVYAGMQIGDSICAYWKGTPANPLTTFPEIHTVERVEPMRLGIQPAAIYHEWKTLEIWYQVQGLGRSPSVHVAVVA